MTWLLWRQHRLQGAVTGAVLASLAVLLGVSGVRLANAFRDAMNTCRVQGSCDLVVLPGDHAVLAVVNLTVVVPVLVGVFWGATALGRDLDAGTNRLVWTQSISRRRWVRGKVVVLLVAAAFIGAATSGMVTWWWRTQDEMQHDRFEPLPFDLQGVAPVAYTLFAAALGLAAGVLWRRTMPAIATTVAGFVAVRLLIELYARPHYRAPLTAVAPLRGGDGGRVGAWTVKSDIAVNGHVLTGAVRMPAACQAAVTRADADACLTRLGYRMLATYQPASRFWQFQWIESGAFLVLAAVLVVVAVVVVRRRDA